MKRFKDILYVVETGGACKPALERAVTLAENNQANLTIIDFVERVAASICVLGGGPRSVDTQTAMPSSPAQSLEDLIYPYHERIKIKTKALKGTPFMEIIREVLRNGHDLVIKSPEIRDGLNRFFGSTDMHLLRKCPCPVWITNSASSKNSNRILAAVDVDDSHPSDAQKSRHELSLQILEMARSLASCSLAELHIVHAWELKGVSVLNGPIINMSEEKVLAEVEQVRRKHTASFDALLHEVSSNLDQEIVDYPEPQTHLVKGSADKEIPELAKQIEADLIVIGTVARCGVPGFFLGNTAEKVLNQVDCSVLSIKPACFVTSVSLE